MELIYLKKYLKQKNIEYFSFTKKISKMINQSDCVILPSYREGLSKSLLEASALEKFIICSNVPGCNEIIINNYNGFLSEPKNTNDLIDKINKFMKLKDSKINVMQKRSSKRTYKIFRDKLIIKKYLNLINDIKNN